MATISAAYAKQYYLNKGYTNVQASGLVGGLETESGLNTGAYNPNDPGGSTGIGQWSPTRWAAENTYAASQGLDPYSADAQLGFVDYELHGTESTAGNALFSATTAQDATAAALDYERPAGWTASNPLGAVTYSQRLTNTVALEGTPGTDVNSDPGTEATNITAGSAPSSPSTTGQTSQAGNVSTGGAVPGSIASAIASAGNAISKTIGSAEQAAQTAAVNSVTGVLASTLDSVKDYFGRATFIILGVIMVGGAVYLFTKDKVPYEKIALAAAK